MSKIFQNVKIELTEDVEKKLHELCPGWTNYRILRQSVDARTRHQPHFVMTIEVAMAGEKLPIAEYQFKKVTLPQDFSAPLIVGSGPAGLFAALRLVERGIPCHLFEQGSPAETRIKGINRFWRYGEIDPRNNVCFGEGGAGLYSDGKLVTRIKSPHIPYVMDRLVQFGAPAEIRYLSNPHVGSDKIRRVIPQIRNFLQSHGCTLHFDTKVTELLLSSDQCQGLITENGQTFSSPSVILATGHSAEGMLIHLKQKKVYMEAKDFAVGLRIEHPQPLINKLQYRESFADPRLGSANYKITYHDHEQEVGVYSFCMCPGGYVLSSGTESGRIVSNGMSNFKRNSPFANSAIVITVNVAKLFPDDLWGGMKLRESLEQKAFQLASEQGATKELPAQRLTNFISGRRSKSLELGSSPSGAISARLDQLFPAWINDQLKKAFANWEKQMPGFVCEQAIVYGVESRTSCPIRITRDDHTLESISHRGLFPCGEGAGYAGGITSAACDGIRIADRIAEKMVLAAI